MNIEQLWPSLLQGPLVLFAANLDWSPIYISPNIEALLGYPVDTFFKDPNFWLGIIHPDDQVQVAETLAKLPGIDHVQDENRLRHLDGQYVFVRTEIKFMPADVNGPDRYVGYFLDSTKDVQQKLELERQKQALADANESLEQFVYVASHDLREPLIGVAGYATLVLKRYADKLDDQGKHFINEVVRGCKSMEQKIDDLLELSRAGNAPHDLPFPLGSAVEQARRSLVGSIEKSGAVIRYDSLPMVRGDRGQIAQVFQNLFSNSIKYRSKDVAPVIDVAIEPYEDPNFLCITVKDNGIGFDMRHMDRIFGVFQRLYTIDQYPGTGIGLAIVKKIIDIHGGKIWVLSKPGGGTTFYFTLAKPDL